MKDLSKGLREISKVEMVALKKHLLDSGGTLVELQAESGLSYWTIRRIMSGKQAPHSYEQVPIEIAIAEIVERKVKEKENEQHGKAD